MRACLSVDRKQLIDNYRNLVDFLAGKTKAMCVVKCNGYGHGAKEMVKILSELGCDYFAVSCLAEALELRDNGLKSNIIILSHTSVDQIDKLIEYDLVQTVGDLEYGKLLAFKAQEKKYVVRIHLKVDTGMHRLGITQQTDIKEIKKLVENDSIKLEGCLSHLAVSDSFAESDVQFTRRQKETFDAWLQKAREAGIKTGTTSLMASGGIVNYPEYLADYDYCRPGLVLIGADTGDMKHPYARDEIGTIESVIEKIDILPKETTIGYGRTFQSDKDLKVATVLIGYGDGIPRYYPDGQVLIRGQRCPIIGRISMDQLCVDVSSLEDVALFDQVVLVGKQGKETITLRELADKANSIPNEIATKLTNRLPRIYK